MQREELIHECEVFTRYLLRRPPNQYIIDRYCEYHTASSEMNGDSFDLALTRFAVRHSLCLKMADAYSSRFCRNALLRRKLVLILGLGEVTAPFFYHIEAPDSLPRLLIMVKLAAQGVSYAAALAAGMIVLGPVHAIRARARPIGERVQ